MACGPLSCVLFSLNRLLVAKKPPPQPPEKPLFSFTNEPPPAAVFKFTARVLNAVAPGSPYAQVSVTRRRDRYSLQSHACNTKPLYAQGDLICFHARHVWQVWKEPQVSKHCHTLLLRGQLRTSHYVDFRLQQSRFCASKCEQVLCFSWNRTKVAQILEEEQPLSTFAANRQALGANDSTVFDYCNCSSQPADQDIIDSLRLNPKVTPCELVSLLACRR